MQEPTESHPPRTRRARRFAGTIAALIAAGAAYVSYTHGLDVARWVGNTGTVAYVVPALPDGLIAISTVSLYEAAQTTGRRPPWAIVGLVLGIGLTIVMNVAAGTRHGWGGALVAAMVPVVLLLALEILTGVVRRGRGGASTAPAPATLADVEPPEAVPGQPPAEWLDEQIRTLRRRMPERATAEALGVSRTRVQTAMKRAVLPAAPEPVLNGAGPHE